MKYRSYISWISHEYSSENVRDLPSCAEDNIDLMLHSLVVNKTLRCDLLHRFGESLHIVPRQGFEESRARLIDESVLSSNPI